MAINTVNNFMVGACGDVIKFTKPPLTAEYLTREEAVRLAAWLVVMAGDYDAVAFGEVLNAIKGGG